MKSEILDPLKNLEIAVAKMRQALESCEYPRHEAWLRQLEARIEKLEGHRP